MVMEYLVGETLQRRLKRLNTSARTMPLDEALRLCIQICEAAGYAHDHEMVHRDIKPANILINVNGQAILMDFGIVKIMGGEYHTATGATIGTAMYMSPEQIRSERVDERADIYSLGVTLYEMLSGQPPYAADSALTLMMMVLNDPLPDLRQARKGIPESLWAAVQKALAKEPAGRFQTMAEMATALRQVQAELTSAARHHTGERECCRTNNDRQCGGYPDSGGNRRGFTARATSASIPSSRRSKVEGQSFICHNGTGDAC
jgi:serine/threonine-protein kinase